MDYLSRLVVGSSSDSLPILEIFSDEQLMSISRSTIPWYADIVNYLIVEQISNSWTKQKRLHFLTKVKWFF